MPYKPKSPCAFPDCPRVSAGRYCEEHARQTMNQYNRYRRDPESNKRYGRRWRKIRAAFLSSHPLCEICKSEGKTVPAEEVHHKLPLSKGGTHHPNNLQALCKPCHSSISAREGDRWGNHK